MATSQDRTGDPATASAHLRPHVVENRRHWDATAADWVAAGERSWRAPEPHRGIWQVANSQLPLLPGRRSSTPMPNTSRWPALFGEVGFEVEDHREVRAPEGGPGYRHTVGREWARKWPSEQVWRLRKR